MNNIQMIKDHDVDMTVTVITPKKALEILNSNGLNRPISERRVTQYAAAMARGEWQFNGDSITISDKGNLTDGQHRLAAIVRSGIPQKYIIVDGLPESVFTTKDTGMARTSAQMLGMKEIKNAGKVAAVTALCLIYERTGNPYGYTVKNGPTHTQIINRVLSDQLLREISSVVGVKGWMYKYIQASIWGFCYYVFYKDNKYDCESFFNQLKTGEFEYKNSPVKLIREFFIEERSKKEKTQRPIRTALIFHAYRAFREGKELKVIRLPKDKSDWYVL